LLCSIKPPGEKWSEWRGVNFPGRGGTGSFPDRPWDVGNNPKTAVHEWLKTHPLFEIDKDIDNKLLISVAPDGYLKRVG